MKKSLLLKSLIAAIIVCVFGFAAASCSLLNPEGPAGDEIISADKTALEAEIAAAISAQGDYTADSYNAYAAKLAEAKAIAADAEATQEAVDGALAALIAARTSLAIRPIEEVEGGKRDFRLISGDSVEIALADYVNANGLSKISYEVKASNASASVSAVADGKFTITAADIDGRADVKVFIYVSYDGVKKLTVELGVKVTNDVAPIALQEEVVKEYDLFNLSNKEALVLDFAENVDNAGKLALTYSAKLGDEALTLDGTSYTLNFGSYTDEFVYQIFTVTVAYEANGVAGTLEYTYKLGLKDTSEYRVANGSFENGLDGWEFNNTSGDAPFAGIDEKTTFWDQQFPMFNSGKYFSAYADGALEASEGILASSFFKANSKYATYMLGGAGNEKVYITIEDESGNVLAIYRNVKFADLPGGVDDWEQQRQLIGVSVFLCNFVTYKVDISAYEGQNIRFVVHDHAPSGWGVVFFDELNTYYTSESELPGNAVLAENLLADKTALNAEIALEIAEQGDFTEASYNEYIEKLQEAKAVAADVAATKASVDAAEAALKEAREALELRPIEEKAGAEKSFRLIYGKSLEFAISDYVETNGLSSITYEVQLDGETVSISDGKFTITANDAKMATVAIIVSYKGEAKLTVNISIDMTKDLAPTIKQEGEYIKSYDLYYLENKESIVIDFSENIDNPGDLELSYSINGGLITTETHTYYFTYDYTENEIGESFIVTVSYVANGVEGSIQYEYTLAVSDTTAYRMENGGFENGLDGWTVVGNIGSVSSDTHYWVGDGIFPEGYAFGMDGEKMFSAYAPGAFEGAVGTLTSPSFKVGGSGYVSFKVGGMKDGNYVYIDVVDADTKEILARYYNGNLSDESGSTVRGCTLVAYKADLSEFKGREVFFRLSDNADSNYGLFFADSFVTYYDIAPWELSDATPVDYEVSGTIYDLFNGGFEMGDLKGWWNAGTIGAVTGADGFFNENVPYGKDGIYLFSGVQNHGEDFNFEANTGVLTSSVFEIGGSGYITYMLGGGNAFCYVQIIDSTTGEVLARYRQQAREDAKLKSYVADLSAYIGRSVRIQVVDNATYDWGCVSFDGVKTYYESKPEGFIDAIDVKYEILNGSFENGLDGWKQNIWEAGAHGTLGWVESSEHDAGWYTKNDDRKDGNNIFTFCKPDGTNCENTKGELVSTTFTLKQDSFVSFRFGAAGSRAVRIELVRANGEVIATFYNEAPGKANTEMYAYYYQYTGDTTDCFFRVVDDSVSGYGCVVVDDFRVNLESAPEGFIAAIQ